LKSVNIFFKKCDVSPSVTQLRRLNDVAGMCLLSAVSSLLKIRGTEQM